ncbi:polysaccharide pyruvyl transferase family protein [Paenibacillus humicola]|uniref:polysaccharide pyruvyl transferase family protein n=1 Tax=Paenibacillus humicola TaxID=3110540 RepID=UPI00237AD663|nr:polysaccharide pyruvyl transferase family protein [Paenibacillus humicola]
MKICTITCHNVYNHGASLQAYALMKYLMKCGHEVEIIDYRPGYLSSQYKLTNVNSPKWERNLFTRLIYITLKLPFRIRGLKRKRSFDAFTKQYLKLTPARYSSYEELKSAPPQAEAYICGSDQIWNSLHRNGKDPAFYLDFIPDGITKMSYAASFATDTIADEYKPLVKKRVERLNGIGVRESSGIKILEELGVKDAVNVLDPAFLLTSSEWDQVGAERFDEPYILIYDFDNSQMIKDIALKLKKKYGYRIFLVNPNKLGYADRYFTYDGPSTFVSLIRDAKLVISNSYHAVVFSIIYETEFFIVNRTEAINTRMRDLLNDLNLSSRLIGEGTRSERLTERIDFKEKKKRLEEKIAFSKRYLASLLES